ncbi:NADP-dependent oxidoreductase [Cupriavidus taiwanensis]|uniref:NADP-dependent oxidoreductase n=1 Tax=Cupriavidus taiwanensis TaxID=164546 RepID=UPI000E11C457|nr:NADP-dependent oxidoreductase [Cupriavidus taiwanensis]SOZ29627.1 Oxidoreductase, zinc-binding [Cupriavidus taiwanensis]SPA34455.1 Oxidoreductase, zinc-binding [Cupriavidus taiwanensis]
MAIPISALNRQWLLAERPAGNLTLHNFEYRETPFSIPDLKEGEILLHNRIFTCAPVMRNFMNELGVRTRISIPVGTPVIGPVGAEVIDSRNPDFPVGSLIDTVGRWEDYSVVNPRQSTQVVGRASGDISLMDLMGPLSTNSLTAYFGIFDVCKPKKGESVVISAAAGSVGMMACQFAKMLGCHVIGIAGGKEKCRWLVDELKIDGAIDYKSEDVGSRLAEMCPSGVNAYFDNVGGQITQAVIDNIAPKGRIAVCGQVSSYDSGEPPAGPRDMMSIVYSRVRIEGFTVADWSEKYGEARAQMHDWFRERKLVTRTDIRRGFTLLPAAFLDLFDGKNQGSLLVTGSE